MSGNGLINCGSVDWCSDRPMASSRRPSRPGVLGESSSSDRLREKCGVFGIWAPGDDVARITFFGLYSLQHRRQERPGVAVADGADVRAHKRMGLVWQVSDEPALAQLRGFLAVGHTRYSTMGSSCADNAQPLVVASDLGQVVLAHNGNLTNVEA